jgi:lipocalin-like protein
MVRAPITSPGCRTISDDSVIPFGMHMRAFTKTVLVLVIAAVGGRAQFDASAGLIGSWKLISYELRLASGDLLKPFGDHPTGRVLYQRNGQMSAQLMDANTAAFTNADPLKSSKEETDRAWRNYIGYWGTFRVDTKKNVVVHHIEGCWFPNWIGTNQIRSFHFKGNNLILEADSPSWHSRLVWEKIGRRHSE